MITERGLLMPWCDFIGPGILIIRRGLSCGKSHQSHGSHQPQEYAEEADERGVPGRVALVIRPSPAYPGQVVGMTMKQSRREFLGR